MNAARPRDRAAQRSILTSIHSADSFADAVLERLDERGKTIESRPLDDIADDLTEQTLDLAGLALDARVQPDAYPPEVDALQRAIVYQAGAAWAAIGALRARTGVR